LGILPVSYGVRYPSQKIGVFLLWADDTSKEQILFAIWETLPEGAASKARSVGAGAGLAILICVMHGPLIGHPGISPLTTWFGHWGHYILLQINYIPLF
jgi:hypothetical protein